MKQVISAKLKLHTEPEQFQALRHTHLAYRDGLNAVSRYAYERGKTSNNQKLHLGMYAELRTRYHLPSQLACSVERQVAATYKGLWTKMQKNTQHRKAGITKKRFKGLDQPPKYVSPTMQYTYERDYSFESHKDVIGVDVGIRYLAVTSTARGVPTFHSGKAVREQANHYARLRKRLQKKGTRNATRRLRRIAQRERRLKQQANHVVSKHIVTTHPQSLIGLEQLTDIRDRTRRRRRRRKKNGKGTEPVSSRARKANRVYAQWTFAQLHALIASKAVLSGSMAIKVDANYTSKACPKCGFTCDANRPEHGLLFHCRNCHYELHADLVGARNITMRTLLLRQDWGKTGYLSVSPDASDKEAKALRLQRYSELWWSPEASSSPFRGLSH